MRCMRMTYACKCIMYVCTYVSPPPPLQPKLVVVEIQGVELANKDGLFGISDPYLKFFALKADGAMWTEHTHTHSGGALKDEYKTETINNNANPLWKPFSFEMDKLCNGNPKQDAKFRIECWDKDSMKEDDFIGWTETTVNQMLTFKAERKPLLLNDRPGGNTAKPGSLAILSIEVRDL